MSLKGSKQGVKKARKSNSKGKKLYVFAGKYVLFGGKWKRKRRLLKPSTNLFFFFLYFSLLQTVVLESGVIGLGAAIDSDGVFFTLEIDFRRLICLVTWPPMP